MFKRFLCFPVVFIRFCRQKAGFGTPQPLAVCGARHFPCRERLRHLPTTAHSAPSLYLPPAALGLEALT